MPDVGEVERRLREDTPFYAQHCLHIVNEEAETVPFVYRPAQLKVEAAMRAQAAAGLPVRVVVLKARRVGISSSGMAKLTQTTTLKDNRQALIVAHDKDTAGELFDLVAQQFYPNLPMGRGVPEWLKPGIVSMRNNEDHKLLHFGNPGTKARLAGDLGVNSRLRIDTAKEVTAGRGKTITDLWLTEVAFWPNPEKFLSLMNAVFDRPGTMIVVESTANGLNAFKPRVERAQRGEGNFAFVFISWLEDPEHCWQTFTDPDARAKFVESIGRGEFGEDEPALVELGAAPEQLLWRRNAIVDKCDGQIEKFHQEYPSTPQEAFIASGRNYFSIHFTARVLKSTEETEPQADIGLLQGGAFTKRKLYSGDEIEVPTSTLWVPQQATGFAATHDFWRVWQHPWKGTDAQIRETRENAPERLPLRPENPGQYIVSGDVASGEGEDWHAAQVIDHLTGEQVAEYRSRIDPDEFTLQLLLAALYWNRAWIAVETTGGYGGPIVRGLRHKLGYPMMYMQSRVQSGKQKQEDRLGWDTNRRTKPLLLAEATALLREGTDGVRSRALAHELTYIVRHDDGTIGASDAEHDDLFMAWGIAQVVRRELPARTFSALPAAPAVRRLPGR